ncbi:uncharacterized protein LOC142985320 [Anticarsia gemmatalis]|uniref:uncharacterized protein LOC142985320 n=1 Tax=Anticarsia gemmatalis TaxID=129554 RepID=UPI003F75E960
MDNNNINEPLESNPTSLQGLHTDFDNWVIRYCTYYKRIIGVKQNGEEKSENNNQNINKIILEDVFIADILLKQRNNVPTAKQPSLEHDGFLFLDHIFCKMLNNNGDRRFICRIVRSKL